MSVRATIICMGAAMVLGATGLLVAAGEGEAHGPVAGRYDASIIATGDLVVVDQHTGKLHIYGQHKQNWVLRSTTDLTQAGAVKIEPEHPSMEAVREAMGRGED